MYIPTHFNITDVNEIKEFIVQNSFGTIVSTENNRPIATHIPMQLHKRGDDYVITGHMAYANPQWKTFNNLDENILVMFQGPHAYISSSWYEAENVPTWNYQSVHVYGRARLMSEEELEEDLILLLEKYEQDRDNPVVWGQLSAQTKKQIRGIVGFSVQIEEVQAAYKMSQNRNERDYENIIKTLQEENDVQAQVLAKVMKNRISN